MQKIDRTRRKRRYLALSFAVPFGVMLLCFVLGGLWPFGDRQVLAHDMWHQYYPFFVSFREKLRSRAARCSTCARRAWASATCRCMPTISPVPSIFCPCWSRRRCCGNSSRCSF